jgi:hypothetical protein
MLPPWTLSQVNPCSLLNCISTLLVLSLSYSSPRVCTVRTLSVSLIQLFQFNTGFAPLLCPFAFRAVIWSQALEKGAIAPPLKWPVHGRFVR